MSKFFFYQNIKEDRDIPFVVMIEDSTLKLFHRVFYLLTVFRRLIESPVVPGRLAEA